MARRRCDARAGDAWKWSRRLDVTGWLIISRAGPPCDIGQDGAEIAIHQRLDMGQARRLRARRHEIAAEDRRQRVAVGQVEIAESGDRYIELHGIDTLAEVAAARASLEDFGKRGNQRRMHGADFFRA